MPLVITGASGHLGHLVANELLERIPAAELVLVTRHTEALRDFSERGVTVRHGDFDDPASLPEAFAGGERMLLISTLVVGRRTAQHRAAIEAAVAAGVRHVVYTSFPNPVADHPTGPVAIEHAETEQLLHESGLEWTVLRNGTYAELQIPAGALAVAGGKLYSNAGDGLLVPIARSDCAAAAAAVLTSDGHAGMTYDVTGPEALSQADIVAAISEVSGRPVELISVSDHTLLWGLTRNGVPKAVARAIVDFGKAIREGYYDVTSDAVQSLTGHAPRSLRDVLMANRDHLLAASGRPQAV
jgi:NAD(P)H dehydrogenase (quinone)